MVSSAVVLILVIAMGLAALRISQVSRLRRISLQRAGIQVQENTMITAVFVPDQPALRVFPPRYRYAPVVSGLLFAGLVYGLTNLPIQYSIAGAIVIAAITYLVEMYWADSNIERIESQLADGIDLMVASLRAGSALVASLEATLRETRQPLRGELENVVARIRLGEDPQTAVRELAARVPLESFRLFVHSLLVHWETGGSLATSLRTVGRTVRDRLEISRRISAQAVESQISVVAVMAIAYGLTVFMLNSNPGPLKKLLYSQIGAYIAAGVMILQAIGMIWIWRMSRIRF